MGNNQKSNGFGFSNWEMGLAALGACLALSSCSKRDFSAEVTEQGGAGVLTSVYSRTSSEEEALIGLNKWVKEHPGRRVVNVESVFDVGGFQVTTTTFEGLKAWTVPAEAVSGPGSDGPLEVSVVKSGEGDAAEKANEWARSHPRSRIVSIETVKDVSGFKYVYSTTEGLRIWSRMAAPAAAAASGKI